MRSFHPAEAARLTGVELRLLCSLLSVVWEASFAVKVGPLLEGRDAVAYLRGAESGFDGGIPSIDFEVPAWVQQGAEIAQRPGNEYLAQALGACRDALFMEHELPSQACMAYVAVIESIGKKRGLSTRSRDSVVAALKQVLFIDEAVKAPITIC